MYSAQRVDCHGNNCPTMLRYIQHSNNQVLICFIKNTSSFDSTCLINTCYVYNTLFYYTWLLIEFYVMVIELCIEHVQSNNAMFKNASIQWLMPICAPRKQSTHDVEAQPTLNGPHGRMMPSYFVWNHLMPSWIAKFLHLNSPHVNIFIYIYIYIYLLTLRLHINFR